MKIMPRVSLGITFNIWDDGITKNEWEQKSLVTGTGTYEGERVAVESYSFDRFHLRGLMLIWGCCGM